MYFSVRMASIHYFDFKSHLNKNMKGKLIEQLIISDLLKIIYIIWHMFSLIKGMKCFLETK